LLIAAADFADDKMTRHIRGKFAGPKANTGTVTHDVENGKNVLMVSEDFTGSGQAGSALAGYRLQRQRLLAPTFPHQRRRGESQDHAAELIPRPFLLKRKGENSMCCTGSLVASDHDVFHALIISCAFSRIVRFCSIRYVRSIRLQKSFCFISLLMD
jgi:hypothetical protein